MDSIIEILFDALEPERQSPKERAAIHAAEENLRQVKEKLTEEESESLAATFLDIGSINCQDSFARGLRLGMRIMLEGFRAEHLRQSLHQRRRASAPYPSRIPRSSFKSAAMYSAPAFSCSARLP